MARDFETPVIYDAVTRQGQDLNDIWVSWFTSFYETLVGYLSQNGIFVPKLTTDQRDSITNAENGQMIYNTDFNGVEYYVKTNEANAVGHWGFFLPHMTTTQRDNIASPRLGQLIYNTTDNKMQGYEGSPGAWVNLV